MVDSLDYDELLQQYKELQLRVTRFSATEQALINTRDRLDQELVLYKRINHYNAQSLQCEQDSDFYQLICEAIVDVFEMECAVVGVRVNESWEFYQEGANQSVIAALLNAKSKGIRVIKNEAQSEVLHAAELNHHFGLSAFSSAVISEINDEVLKFEVLLMGLISTENEGSYQVLEARHQAIFNVFVQQFQALLSNRIRGKEIQNQLIQIQTSQQELKKLSLIATKTKSGVIITDTFGKIEWVNEAFCNISGYQLADVLGKKPKDLLQGKDTDEQSKASLREALWNKKDIELTIVNHDINGKPYYNQLEIISVFDDQGKHVNFIALQKDITSEIIAQQEIMRMNSRFELITRQSKIGIWEFNAETGEVVWNAMQYQIYGVDPEAQLDLKATWNAAVDIEDKPQIDIHHAGLVKGEISVQQDDYRIRRLNDGQLRTLETLTIAERNADGKLLRLVGTALDVTEAKALLKERDASVVKMNELKLFYEGILNHSPGDIFVFDANGFLMYCNTPSSEDRCWWNPFVRQSIFDEDNTYSIRQINMINAIRNAIKEKAIIRCEDVMDDGVGESSYYLQSILPYFNPNGNLEHIIVSGVDISDQKRNELILHGKNEELKKINAELDNFVYSISHDLRSPLLSIKGILSLVMSNEGLDESTIQFLQMAEVSVTRLDGTIQEILEYSRNSRLGIEQVEVNIERLIYEIFDDLRFSNDKVHQWNVHVECQGDVMTDKARLKVLLRNIIGNSVKYSRQGEINQVEVRVYQMDRRLCFEVKDNGEGISKESISRVFEMFYRGTSNSQGTGLGLYICKEIISKMKGEIKIESELGKGTSVYFWIPYLS